MAISIASLKKYCLCVVIRDSVCFGQYSGYYKDVPINVVLMCAEGVIKVKACYELLMRFEGNKREP